MTRAVTLAAVVLLAAVTLGGGCATHAPGQPATEVAHGRIERWARVRDGAGGA